MALVSLKGRMTRRSYILVNLSLVILSAGADALSGRFNTAFDKIPVGAQAFVVIALLVVIVLLVWIIGVRLPVRRLHDMNLSGAYWFAVVLLNLVPYLGTLGVFVWLSFIPGTKGRNEYGADPRGPRDEDIAKVFDGSPPAREATR